MAAATEFRKRVGPHLNKPGTVAANFSAIDGLCDCSSPLRDLKAIEVSNLVDDLKQRLKIHHASPEALSRYEKRKALAKKIGLRSPFPSFDNTKRGNFAEVVLADYLSEITSALLPVYRLRYNPNIEQSMKGDDVLVFSLGPKKKRIFIGEAKFRNVSNTTVVKEICEALQRSANGGLPTSLSFVVDRLYEAGAAALASQIDSLSELYADNKVEITYVGFLLSNLDASHHAKSSVTKLVDTTVCMLTLGIENPVDLVEACFAGL